MPASKKLAAVQSTERDLGQPAGRLLELTLEVKTPEPYVVTDRITIYPPTKKTAARLDELNWAVVTNKAILQEALRRNMEDSPTPAKVKRAEDMSDEDFEAAVVKADEEHVASVDAWQSRTLASGELIKELQAKVEEDTIEWNRVFFGNRYDELQEFFDDRPKQLWERFVDDIRSDFLSTNSPDDGVCSKCGHVTDEDAAGKGSESST